MRFHHKKDKRKRKLSGVFRWVALLFISLFLVQAGRANTAPYFTVTLSDTILHEDQFWGAWLQAQDDENDPLTWSLAPGAPEGMSINSSIGTVEWTPTNDDVGINNITAVVSDGSLTDTLRFRLHVRNTNDPPEIVSTPITYVYEDLSYLSQIKVNEIDVGDSIRFSLVSPPEGMTVSSVDADSGIIQWNPDNADVGTYNITLVATDDSSATDTLRYSLEVYNVRGEFTTLNPTSEVTEDQTYSYDLNSTDEGQGSTQYSFLQGTDWLSINSTNGTLSGTPDNTNVGVFAIEVLVNDGHNGKDTLSFSITVHNDPVEFTSSPTLTVNEDEAYNVNLESDDEGQGSTQYTLTTNPGWLSIISTTGVLSGTPDNSYVGNNTVQVVVDDGNGGKDTLDFTIIVANAPPTITTSVLSNATEDEAYSGNIQADDEGQGSTSYRFLTDLQTPPDWLSLNPSSGVVSGTPLNADVGTNSFTIEFDDGNGARDTMEISFTVSNDPPAITTLLYPDTTSEDALYSYRFRSDDDGSGTITYHSFRLPSWLSLNLNTGLLSGTPDNGDVGSDSVGLYVDDGNGGRDSIEYVLVVENTAPELESTPVTAATEDSEYTYDIDYDDEGLGSAAYTWDMVPAPDWLTLDNSTGELSGTPSNGEVGTTQIRVKLSDGNGAEAIHAFNLTISNVPPSFTTVNDTSVAEDATLALNINTDDENDPSVTYEIISPSERISINSATGALSYTPNNADVPSQEVQVKCTDNNGGADTLIFTVTITNTAPSISGYTVSGSPYSINGDTLFVKEDKTYQLDFTASDEGQGDDARYLAAHLPTWLSLTNSSAGILGGTPTNAHVGLDSLELNFLDGNGGAASEKIYLSVQNVRPSFSAHADADTAVEDQSFSFDLDCSDDGAGTVTYSIISGDPGWFTLNASTGEISNKTGRPDNDDVSGGDAVTFKVEDGNGGSDTTTVVFVVHNTNDAPTWSSAPLGIQNVNEDETYSDTISATDVDLGDEITYALTTSPSGMTISSSTGAISWTPDNSTVGDFTVTATATDDSSATITRSWTVRVQNAASPIVDPGVTDFTPSAAVTADADTFEIWEDTTYTINLDAPDEDTGPSSSVKYSLDDFSNPDWFTLSDDTLGILRLTPSNNDVGLTSARVYFTDQPGSADTLTLWLRVKNVAPVITTEGPFNATEDVAFRDTVECSDDDDGSISYSFSGAHPGWLSISSSGVLTGTPENDDVISEGNFTVQVDDGNGGVVTKSFLYSVQNVNDSPVWSSAPSGNKSTAEDALYSEDLDASDVDAGDALTYFLKTAPDGMSINSSTGVLNWTPDNDDIGTYSIIAGVYDSSNDTITANWNLTVTNVAAEIQSPTVNDFSPSVTLSDGKFQLYEDTTYTLNLTASDEDVGSPSTVKYSFGGFSNPDWISLTNATSGIITLAPSNEDVGEDSFKVYFTDYPGSRDTLTVYLNVVNVPPLITTVDNISATEDLEFRDTLHCTDDGEGTITWSFVSGKPSWLDIDSASGILSGTPTNDNVISEGSFTIQVDDGNGGEDTQVYSYSVTNVNDAPTWDATISDASINEDAVYSVTLSASDVDVGDEITYSFLNAPPDAGLNNSTGAITWTPDNSEVGTHTFQVKASDNSGSNIQMSWQVTVNNVASPISAPTTGDFSPSGAVTANADTFLLWEDTTYVLDLDAPDEDVGPSSTVKYSFGSFSNPDWISLGNDTLGRISLQPENEDVGSDSLKIYFTDQPGSRDTLTVYLRVRNVPPQITTLDNISATEDEEFTDTLHCTDDGSGGLTWSFASGKPSWLEIGASTGILTGTPENGDVITDGNFTILVQDGNGGEDSHTYSYSVTNVNDTPVWASTPSDSAIQEDQTYTVTLSANDADAGDNVTYSLVTSPGGMNINSSSGMISWTPDNGDVGVNTVKAKASDASGAFVTKQWSLTVQNDPSGINNVTISSFSPSDFVSVSNDTFRIKEDTVYTLNLESDDEGEGENAFYTVTNLSNPDWITLTNSSSGLLRLAPENEDVGLDSFRVVFSDNPGSTDTVMVYIRVENVPPVLASAGPFSVDEDEYFEYDLSSTDEGSGTIQYELLAGSPDWLSIVSNTGVIYGTPENDNVGTSSFNVRVSDGNGGTDARTYSITVNNTNDAPVITVINDTTVNEDALFLFNVIAQDNDEGDSIAYSLQISPTGMSIDSTGKIRWTPDNNQVGTHPVKVRATDRSNAYSEESFSITVVNRLPQFSTTPSGSSSEDNLYSQDIDCDDEGEGGTYYYEVVFPAWLSLTDAGEGIIQGTPTNADVGDTLIKIGANDGNGGKDTLSWSFTITNVVPQITSDADTQAVEEQYYSYNVESDDEGSGTAFYTAPILPDWLSINSSTGVLSGTPGNDDVGENAVLVQFNDGNGGSATQSFSISVQNVNDAPEITSSAVTNAVEDQIYIYDVDATDVDGDVLTYSLIEKPSGMSVNSSSGVIQWTPDNSNVGEVISVSVKVVDPSGESDTQTWIITVDNSEPAISTRPSLITATEDSSFQYNLEADDEGLGSTLYSILQAPTWLSIQSSTGVLSGTPDNSDVGTDSLIVKFDDGNSGYDTLFTEIRVINTRPVFSNQADTSAAEDQFFSLDLQCTDETESSVTYSSLGTLPEWITLNSSDGILSGTPLNNHVGNHSVSVMVNDGNGGKDTLSFNITVNNARPEFSGTPLSSIEEDSAYSFDLTCSDEGQGSMTYSFITHPDWLSLNASTGLLSGTPLNNHVGTNAVEVKVEDGNGGSDTLSFSVTVSNSPPVITSTPSGNATEDAVYSTDINCSDEGQGVMAYSFLENPAWMSLNPSNGRISGTPKNKDVTDDDSSRVIVSVSDGNGGKDTLTYYIKIANTLPVITTTTIAHTVSEDSLFRLDVDCSDEEPGSEITYTFLSDSASHPWLSLDPDSGIISGTPLNNHVRDSLIVEVEVNDGHGGTDSQIYYLTITNSVPEFTSVNDSIATEDVNYLMNLETSDENQGASQYSFQGSHPGWLSLDALTGELSGTPENSDVDTDLVQIKFNDGNGAEIFTSFHLIVLNVNDAPVILSVDSTDSVFEDSPWSWQLKAQDADSAYGDTLTFLLSGAPAGMNINEDNGTVDWLPDNSMVGVHAFYFIAEDSSGARDSLYFSLSVINTNDPPVLASLVDTTAYEDQLFRRTVHGSDPDVGDTIHYNLIQNPEGMSIDDSSGVIQWIPDNADVGDWNVITRVVDLSTVAADTDTFIVTVLNVNDVPQFDTSTVSVEIFEDSLWQSVFTATDDDSSYGDSLSYSLYQGFPGMNLVDSTGELSWTPTNENVGVDSFYMVATDLSSAADTLKIIFTVLNTNDPPEFLAIPDTVAYEDSLFVFDLPYQDVDPVDSANFSLSEAPDSMTIDSLTGRIEWIPENDDRDQNFRIIARVRDGAGAADQDTFSIYVYNVNDPPVLDTLQTITFNEDSSIAILSDYWYPFTEDIDNPDTTLSFSVLPFTNLTVTVSEDTFKFSAPENWFGNDTSSLVVSDGVLKDTSQLVISVTPVNDAPVIQPDFPDSVIFYEDDSTFLNLNNYVLDVDNDTLELSWEIRPQESGMKVRAIVYDFSEKELKGKGNYRDGISEFLSGGLAKATNSLVKGNEQRKKWQSSVSSPSGKLEYMDVTQTENRICITRGDEDSIIVEMDSVKNHVLFYATPDFYVGGIPFVAMVSDDIGQPLAGSDSATFVISVIPQNDAPVLDSLPVISVKEDSVFLFNFSDYFPFVRDVDNADTLLSWEVLSSEHIQVGLTDSNYTSFPAADWFGTETLKIVVSDGMLADTTDQIVIYRSVNDVPVFSDIPDTSLNEDDTLYISLNNFITDVENSDDQLSLGVKVFNSSGRTNHTSREFGELKGISNRHFADNGIAMFKGTVGKTVLQESSEDSLVVEIDALTHVAAIFGTPDFYSPPVMVRFYCYDDSLSYDSTDVNVEILPVNDKPVLDQLPTVYLPEDSVKIMEISEWDSLVNDVEDADSTLKWRFIAEGQIAVDYDSLNRMVQFSAPENWFGFEELLVVVTDLEGASDSTYLTVSVVYVNDPPKIDTSLYHVFFYQNESLKVDLDEYVYDVDNVVENLTWELEVGDSLYYSFDESTHLLELWTRENWFGEDSIVATVRDSLDSLDREIIHVAVIDTTSPHFNLGVFQNPLVSQYLGIYIYPSERLISAPLIAFDNDTGEVVLLDDTTSPIYYTTYSLKRNGILNIDLIGEDLSENSIHTRYRIGVSRILKEQGGTIVSPDNVLTFLFPPKSLRKDFYTLILPTGVGISSDTSFSKPVNVFSDGKPVTEAMELTLPDTSLGEMMRIIFNIADIEVNQLEASYLGIYHLSGGKWKYVKTYTSQETGTFWAYSDKVGEYQIRINTSNPANILPDQLSLSQNYPNPFDNSNPSNPSTTIEYQIPAGEFTSTGEATRELQNRYVTLKVYNILGQEVRTLVDEEQPPGLYRIVWDGKNNLGKELSSGIYIYQFVVDNKVINKKMTILK